MSTRIKVLNFIRFFALTVANLLLLDYAILAYDGVANHDFGAIMVIVMLYLMGILIFLILTDTVNNLLPQPELYDYSAE